MDADQSKEANSFYSEAAGYSFTNVNGGGCSSDDDHLTAAPLRRGPWTPEEDAALFNYISLHGEGRWNSLSHCAGLRRTGKSCRLRWLNYLRPDVRRGNITLQEQLLILELHSRWGNRWSKIAQFLPGRTDNEIKNYWRTRVQKHAKQLKCDVNSKQFKDTLRYLWIPRLVERIQAETAATATAAANDNGQCRQMAAVGGIEYSGVTPESSVNTVSSVVTAGGLDEWQRCGDGGLNSSEFLWDDEDLNFLLQFQF